MEVVDPKPKIDAACLATVSCAKLFVAYEACADRIAKKGHGECAGQQMDFLGPRTCDCPCPLCPPSPPRDVRALRRAVRGAECIDKCAAPKLFASVK